MRAYYLKGLAFIIQIIFLLIINQIGYQIVHFFDIPIPGNVFAFYKSSTFRMD